MNFQVIVSVTSRATNEQFWKAMDVWSSNPHLINRRISSSVNLLVAEIGCDTSEIINDLAKLESLSKLLNCDSGDDSVLKILNIGNKCKKVSGKINALRSDSKGTFLIVNKFLPRDSEKFSSGIEFIVVEKDSKCLTSFHRDLNKEKKCLGLKRPYRIFYDNDNRFSISVEKIVEDSSDSNVLWLRERVFPRLLKWVETDRSSDDILVEGSLNLISPEKYTNLYRELKKKYGTEMVKKWPECTDPNKFVYEDVAIATYLILLWEKERNENGKKEEKQSFLDLGCGNGLLVYILTSEGHCGMGIDLRKRQIWDIYPSSTRLEERTIVPSSASLFPETDWLIGNHSDELTPWIPVIAARSSYHCRFFLLPCCAHEFDGRKFQRDSAAKSQYFEYMKYVKSVCEGCGFRTDLDKLRIPSTKRICLIGGDRNYPIEKSDDRNKIINGIINARSSKGKEDSVKEDTKMSENQWSRDFKPRDVVERVRNCTQVDKTIIDEIINNVSSHLLRKVRAISRKDEPEKTWNAGGRVELSEIAKIVVPETLKQLKKECGGLQTLLRNNGHIFQVVNGTVQFKVPGIEATNNRKKRKATISVRTKVKPCWFYQNHPDGCPASDEQCNFKH